MSLLHGAGDERASMAATSGTSAAVIARSRAGGRDGSGSGAGIIEGAAGELQVVPGLALVQRAAQQVGRVIADHQRGLELAVAVHAPAQPADGRMPFEQRLSGE